MSCGNPVILNHSLKRWLAPLLLALALIPAMVVRGAGTAVAYQPAPGDFSALGNLVADLLRDRDPGRFATNVTIGLQDLRSLADTNLTAGRPDLAEVFKNTVASEQQKFVASAKALLATGDALHLDFTKGNWRPQVVVPTNFGNIHFNGLQPDGQTLPSTEKLEVIFHPRGARGSNDEFTIALTTLMKFPGGWRAYDGVRWELMPLDVGDKKTPQDLVILKRAVANQGLTGREDPALVTLGDALVQFLHQRDAAVYQMDSLMNSDFVWGLLQKNGQPGASRQSLDDKLKGTLQEQTERARLVLKQMDEAGIDLGSATVQIKDVSVDQVQPQGLPGSLDGLVGRNFKLTLGVTTAAKAKNGASLSGDYMLAADAILRFSGSWKIADNIYWSQWPSQVADAALWDKMKVENYETVHHALPPGSAAPDIEFVTVDGEKKMKLSEFRGKVVVLDFWASWCGPCQGPMAELQKIRQEHPDWKDKVAIVPLSIDDTVDVERKHLMRQGWTNTFNVWCGGGVWNSAPVQAFLVTAVPTTYIIDAEGKIVVSGHPASLPIGQTVDNLLK